jgi:hypothetical protein
MTPGEASYRLSSVLLSAREPLTLREVTLAADLTSVFAREAADRLVAEGRATLLETPGLEPRYRWSEEIDASSRQKPPALESLVVRHFIDYVLRGYTPPAHVQTLAVFQCCIGRPFYRTQSHAFMRHAVQAATDLDPWHDGQRCPVHVVVLASWIGPVPYELQTIHPATVSAGGVKQMPDSVYAAARPILVERMARYLEAHGARYRHVATFTDGRYGQVMRDVAHVSGRRITVLPDPHGPRVERYRGGKPRTYWQRYWVQLALELGRQKGPAGYAEVMDRMRQMGVEQMAGGET